MYFIKEGILKGKYLLYVLKCFGNNKDMAIVTFDFSLNLAILVISVEIVFLVSYK
jgi:hypothetical protein